MTKAPTFDDAVKRYHRELDRRGAVRLQPSHTPECIDGMWYLENANGQLARVVEETGEVIFPSSIDGDTGDAIFPE